MKTLALSFLSNKENDGATVNVAAGFDDKQTAIDFHAKVAALCREYGGKVPGSAGTANKLLVFSGWKKPEFGG